MKQFLLNLKKKSIYILLMLICLSLNSCHSVEDDAKEVCDCYKDNSVENKVECANLYQEYSKKYQLDLSDSMKFQQLTFGCITNGALGEMSKAFKEASKRLSNINADGSISNSNNDLDKANEAINNLNNDVQKVKMSFYLYSILLILVGIALGIYGLKRFKISLALAFVIPTIILLQMLDWLSMGWFIAIITIGVLIFVVSKPLTYFTAWFFICVFVLIPFFMVFDDADIRKTITKVMMAISIAITYLTRKHIKATIIGISSGYSVGIGLASIISAQLFVNGEILNAFLLPGLIIFTGIVCGLVYQFKYMFVADSDVVTSPFSTENNLDNGSNKINFNNYLTKKNGIIVISVLVLVGLFFGYKSFSNNNKEKEIEINSLDTISKPINETLENDTTALQDSTGVHESMNAGNDMNEVKPEIIEDPSQGGVVIVNVEKAFFYSEPNINTKRKVYLVSGQEVEFTSQERDFIYCKFSNDNGKTTEGWMLAADFTDFNDN